MLASGAGRNAARVLSKSTWRRPAGTEQYAGHLQRVAAAYSTLTKDQPLLDALITRRTSAIESLLIHRTFATRPASKPKAHTGRTTTKPRAKKAAATKTKTKKPAKKTVAKKKPAPKPKKVSTKSIKAKKPLSEEEKRKAHIRQLREVAKKPPKRLPETAYQIILSDLSKERKVLSPKEAKEKHDSLTPEAREHYNHLEQEARSKNREDYKAWIESFTPDEVRIINNARQQLKRLKVKGYTNKLKDDRQLKAPAQPHSLFLRDRYNSGDMRGIELKDAVNIIAREWKALPADEKQPYYTEHGTAMKQYVLDVKRVYGRNVQLDQKSKVKTAAA